MDALALPSELSIYTAAELHPQWLAWAGEMAAAGGDAVVDGQAVDQIDGAGVQLLVALQRLLAARACTLRLQAPSRPLSEACAGLGLAAWLGDLQLPPTPEAP
jgi:ABC-type transporter Mla MlaB component